MAQSCSAHGGSGPVLLLPGCVVLSVVLVSGLSTQAQGQAWTEQVLPKCHLLAMSQRSPGRLNVTDVGQGLHFLGVNSLPHHVLFHLVVTAHAPRWAFIVPFTNNKLINPGSLKDLYDLRQRKL